uniref:transporter substrate-binding domain-containing protein n=1 Tax=Ningiella ruwaisensis TaxID=2364274 RepID=UPI0010A0A676|nr:transporter substrate-binding domain-containing protein [Ningiella ruwaisensis]
MKQFLLLIISLTFACSSATNAQSTDTSETSAQTPKESQSLLIGTKVAPPFVIETDDGSLEGISIELWRDIAQELNINYQFQKDELPALINGLSTNKYDASIAAITVTSEREALVDFTHPFYTTGLAIAAKSSEQSWTSAISRFFSWEFFAALSALCLLLLGVGMLLWLFERKHNKEQFGGSTVEGLGSSFWWAAVTMTTVGYGDKAPTTLGGRLVGLVWMFAAIIIISSFTAAIATSLTVSKLSTNINDIDDLYGANVVSLSDSASSRYLTSLNIKHKQVNSVIDALRQLEEGKIDAVVHDKPILQYISKTEFDGEIYILPGEIERQDYAIGLPTDSALRGDINEAMLKIIESGRWDEIKAAYLDEN